MSKALRIPVQYLANLLTAGDTQPVLLALKRMLAMRHFNVRKPSMGLSIRGRWKRSG
ncbi:Respiratory nitrate reductase 1 beta chain [Raoultella ornithinolytica]|nr:Respiratory nitrate reductase 1 beta chain [Raoultella ornithinolytica]